MPKTSNHPRLRTHVRRGANGQVWTYWSYDMRCEGKPDINLGKDHAAALAKWDELHNQRPAQIGRLAEAFARWSDRELPKYANADTRRSYARQLASIAPVFGAMVWDDVTLPVLREYLDRRSAKVQGNRELSLLSVIWGKARLWGMTRLAWPAAGVKNWKNEEHARHFEVTDRLFTAVHTQADQVLRDVMDIATATGMRLTDVRTILLPAGDLLRLKASKTGKAADFDVPLSQVLPDVIARRRALRADHLMLLSTPSGRPVSARMLRERWDDARNAAAETAINAGDQDLAEQIRAMYLRDMRKRASNLASSLAEASLLLQHSSQAVTSRHYRSAVTKLKPVR